MVGMSRKTLWSSCFGI